VERTARRGETAQAGFLLIEAVVSVALVAIVVAAALGAVAALTHAAARTLPDAALTSTAANVLTDLRAATAYDAEALVVLAGKHAEFDADEPAPDGAVARVHVSVAVSRSADGGAPTATVTVGSAAGRSVTLAATLVQEAPPPGSVVAPPTTSPEAEGAESGATAAAPAQPTGTIAL
jgi:type II secretory pathway pseudopilin PulG